MIEQPTLAMPATGFTLRPYQQEAVDKTIEFIRTQRERNGLLVLPTGCHAKGTRVVMFDLSTKAVEDIEPGDELMGPDSTPRQVVALCRGREEMYRITPHRYGAPFVVNRGHILSLECTNEGKGKYPSQRNGGERDNISVGDYLSKSNSWRHLRKLRLCHGVGSASNDKLTIDPWLLGVLLGDGCMKNGVISVTSADQEIADLVTAAAESLGCIVRVQRKPENRAVALHIQKGSNKRHRAYANPLMHKLRALGLAGRGSADKFIPGPYKTASMFSRRQLLAGLIDTDGSHNGKGGIDYISKSEQLASDVTFVARSLGIACSMATCEKRDQAGRGGTYYRVQMTGPTDQIPCSVPRKRPAPRLQKKSSHRTGFSVEPCGVDDFYGFTLDGDHLYLTDDFIVHHNSGKSLVVAELCRRLAAPTLVFQPSKEILAQNAAKYRSCGHVCGIYSASAGEKTIRDVTFATVGSVVKKKHLLERFQYVLCDEAHFVNANRGMFEDVITHLNVPVVGLTATPYRLGRVTDIKTGMTRSMLKFLTRTNPRVFDRVIYHVQNGDLFRDGFLARLKYYSIKAINVHALQSNGTGADYTDSSVREQYRASGFHLKLAQVVTRLFHPEVGRRNALVFTRFVDEARWLVGNVPGGAIVTAETPAKERDRIITMFKLGRIRYVANVGILTTGFDYPELEAVVVARPTMSLALWYQMVGRGIRPHPDKDCTMIVDMGGNIELFGHVEDLVLSQEGGWHVSSNGRQLTNVPFGRAWKIQR